MAVRPGRGPLLVLVALLFSVRTAAKGAAPEVEDAEGKLSYLWPIHMSSFPLAGPKVRGGTSMDPPSLGKKLADIGMRGFKDYVKNTLPLQLKADQELAESWNRSDHSRVNLAFQRWQKRVFVEHTGIAPEALISKNSLPPKLEGLKYSWPELYQSAEFDHLKGRIGELAKLYLKRSGAKNPSNNFTIFTWVEVYEKNDAMRPDCRVEGAHVAGRFFAAMPPGAQKFNFEDPRGINPPFGKTFSHTPYEGNLVLHPVWNSYFVTPNMKPGPVVVFAFLVYPLDGTLKHWKNEPTGSLIVERRFKTSTI